MQVNYIGLIDTIILKGKVRLLRAGSSLFPRTFRHNRNDVENAPYWHKLYATQYRNGDKTPELLITQQFDGRVQIHSSKAFIDEYGYGIFMQVPPWIYQNQTRSYKASAKADKTASNTKMYLQITIPSLHNLFLSNAFNDWAVSGITDKNYGKYADMLWDYMMSKTNLVKYGIEPYDRAIDIHKNSLDVVQLDICHNIRGPQVKDILELVSANGYYARKSMRIWNNLTHTSTGDSVIMQDANGIEFRKGKKSSEIYKFYDKELQTAQTYYDAVYTSRDFASARSKRLAADMLNSTNKRDRTLLRYEVSLRKVPSQRNAVDRIYARETGDIRTIFLTDILENTIYNRVPKRVLKEGLFNIFGSEIEKAITILPEKKAMTDTDILQEYGSKGLKYLGVKYLLDKGMSNDQIWKYLANAIRGNSSYEVVRRLRNEIKMNGVSVNWNDSHIKTLDALRDVYMNSLS